MRLTTAGAQLYLTASHVTLVCGLLSWDEYLLRLRFVKDCAEPETLEVRAATDILRQQEFEGEDEWPTGEPEHPPPGEGPSESEVSISDRHAPFEPPVLALIAAASTGLHHWQFHQADPDFSRRSHMATRALMAGGSSTSIVAGHIKMIGRLAASRAGRSLRYGTTISFAPSRLQRFSTTWLPSRGTDGPYSIL